MATGRPTSIQVWASDLGKTTAFYRDFLGFQLDEPHLHARAVELGVPVLAEPHTEDWGRGAKYEDPDRNVISLSE